MNSYDEEIAKSCIRTDNKEFADMLRELANRVDSGEISLVEINYAPDLVEGYEDNLHTLYPTGKHTLKIVYQTKES